MNLVYLYVNEWEREPNIKEFEYKGYQCMIKRNPTMLFLCGYVALPEFDEDNDDYMLEDVCPHGGISFSEYPDGVHLPYRNDLRQKLYWVGFDCAHAFDMMPAHRKLFSMPGETYRNMAYVENEIKEMIDQIIENIKKHGGNQT